MKHINGKPLVKYNTVKTTKIVMEADDARAKRLIDSCGPFLTPEIEQAIDFALGHGTDRLDGSIEEVEVISEKTASEILDTIEPTRADLDAIERE